MKEDKSLKIQWLGHASFIITLSDGKKIMTDPVDPKVGYPKPGLAADVVTVSHQHFDHNAVKTVVGKPNIVQKEGLSSIGDIKITGIPSFHDNSKGSQRGRNTIFVIEAEGLRVCHLGDLGHVLDADQVVQIGSVDILLVPVGGFYTIDASEAVKVVGQIKPKIIVPMHYKTRYIDFPISTAEPFLKNYSGYRTVQELEVTAEKLPPAQEVVMLELKQ